ncbi:MAG: hypothetical protein M3P28_00510 [Thermoproteota archaeon]|nr:hypothetical protein [Thermoproteota archaeon]
MNHKFGSDLSSIVGSNRFEVFVGLFTLSSVVLALILYIPEFILSTNQKLAIYIFDLIVVAVHATIIRSRICYCNKVILNIYGNSSTHLIRGFLPGK